MCLDSTHIFLFLSRNNETMNVDKKHDFSTSIPCRTCFVYMILMMSKLIVQRGWWHAHVKTDIWLVTYRFYSRRYPRPVVWEIAVLMISIRRQQRHLTNSYIIIAPKVWNVKWFYTIWSRTWLLSRQWIWWVHPFTYLNPNQEQYILLFTLIALNSYNDKRTK